MAPGSGTRYGRAIDGKPAVTSVSTLERATRIELAFSAWEADVLPLNYARVRAATVSSALVILSDRSIREEMSAGRIVIEPLDESCIQPSSVDLHIDRFFRVFRNHTMGYIDVKQDMEELTELVEIKDDDVFILHPGEFVLGSTSERVALPNDLVARLEGKSSLGRLGLLIHSSLPASERVAVVDDHGLRLVPIGDVVAKKLAGHVVSFDPETFQVAYHRITGWYEGPPDQIFEVVLASG